MEWGTNPGEVILADASRGTLRILTPEGTAQEPIRQGDGKPLELQRPIALQATPEGFLVQDNPWRWVFYDRSFQPVRVLEPKEYPPGVNFISFETVGDEFIGYGRIKKAPRGWTTGFLRVSAADLKVVEVLEEVPLEGLYSMLGARLARLDETVYAIRFEAPSRIMELQPNRRLLRAFPTGFESLPQLPESRGPETAVVRAHALTQKRVAEDLHGRAGFLYLLTREPREGRTWWRLHQIDPQKDALVRTVTLPTAAPHLRLLPGDPEWVVFEYGAVLGPDSQRLESMVRIPAPWIENPGNTRLMSDRPEACR
jgi:hypothetical protein